jgi:hypothetical protein
MKKLRGVMEETNTLPTIQRTKAKMTAFYSTLLIEIAGRQGRRRKQLLDVLKETSGY